MFIELRVPQRFQVLPGEDFSAQSGQEVNLPSAKHEFPLKLQGEY